MSDINLAMLIEYDGANYYGFQKQPSVRTLQGKLEKALSIFANFPIEIITAGRTDTKVHATYQVINFKTHIVRELHSWVRGVNALLPHDIVVKQVVVVPNDFNARFSAICRTYHYYLQVGNVRPAILHSKIGWYHANLDLELMQVACDMVRGEHDFTSFRAANCQAKNPVRNLSWANLAIKNNLLRFEFSANAFLYHMVRNMVGALIYVGNGKLTLDQFQELIKVRNRKFAPPTFMPDGLYLVDIEFNQPVFPRANLDWLF
ncbi:MAG: tRNA pseudouridine(38-40) synthase TruA [Burkholderiales bacterium]|nr:tRNA pseudouridine(38-40) synthase TruA [Burkholderiales bacterium]